MDKSRSKSNQLIKNTHSKNDSIIKNLNQNTRNKSAERNYEKDFKRDINKSHELKSNKFINKNSSSPHK